MFFSTCNLGLLPSVLHTAAPIAPRAEAAHTAQAAATTTIAREAAVETLHGALPALPLLGMMLVNFCTIDKMAACTVGVAKAICDIVVGATMIEKFVGFMKCGHGLRANDASSLHEKLVATGELSQETNARF